MHMIVMPQHNRLLKHSWCTVQPNSYIYWTKLHRKIVFVIEIAPDGQVKSDSLTDRVYKATTDNRQC